MNEIKSFEKGQSGSLDDALASRVKRILEEGTAENTRRAYRKDVHYFMTWARLATGQESSIPVPLALVIRFITDHLYGMDETIDDAMVECGVKASMGTHSLNTICRRIASLSALHESRRMENPCRAKEVTILISKARRAKIKQGITPQKKRAATRDILEAMVSTCGDTLIDTRDRALLFFAFGSGGRRRSEISKARVEHLTSVESGYVYHMPYSKTDQEGQGIDLPIFGRAALALEQWLKVSGIQGGLSSGPLLRAG